MGSKLIFPERGALYEIEEGKILQVKFDEKGLVPCITQDEQSGEILMLGFMNKEAFANTIHTGLAHYYSRERKNIWRKGEKSGLTQYVKRILIDDDQDCILIKVQVEGGASCHVGYRSCFFRKLNTKGGTTDFTLTYLEDKKVFDPIKVYEQ